MLAAAAVVAAAISYKYPKVLNLTRFYTHTRFLNELIKLFPIVFQECFNGFSFFKSEVRAKKYFRARAAGELTRASFFSSKKIIS
jgi:hypothetical protein